MTENKPIIAIFKVVQKTRRRCEVKKWEVHGIHPPSFIHLSTEFVLLCCTSIETDM